MSEPRLLICYDYVNAPYGVVRDTLAGNAGALFQRATLSAAERADELIARLRAEIGPVSVGADIKIRLGKPEEKTGSFGARSTVLPIGWSGAHDSGLFPSMEGKLTITPLSSTETGLELEAQYKPPFGAVGTALDALVMHRVARASLHRFIGDVASALRMELGAPAPRIPEP